MLSWARWCRQHWPRDRAIRGWLEIFSSCAGGMVPIMAMLIIQADRNTSYSTGRGGAGNICKYNAEEVRVAMDVPDGPFRVPRATAAGRGGVGNLQAAMKREEQYPKNMTSEGRPSHDSTRTLETVSSGASGASTASSISESGLAAWGRDRLLGRRHSSNAKVEKI
jgi:hypothetical protein